MSNPSCFSSNYQLSPRGNTCTRRETDLALSLYKPMRPWDRLLSRVVQSVTITVYSTYIACSNHKLQVIAAKTYWPRRGWVGQDA